MKSSMVSSHGVRMFRAVLLAGIGGFAASCCAKTSGGEQINTAIRSARAVETASVTPQIKEIVKPCPTIAVKPVAWRVIDVARGNKGAIVGAEMDQIYSNGNYTRYSVNFIERAAIWRTPSGEMGVPGLGARGGMVGRADGQQANEIYLYRDLIKELASNIDERMSAGGALSKDVADLKVALEQELGRPPLSLDPRMIPFGQVIKLE